MQEQTTAFKHVAYMHTVNSDINIRQ